MRGLVAGLVNPHPLARGLPGIYQEEDRFTVRFTEAFDASLAPIFSTLDNLAAYFDPRYAPEDFLGWLAGWVGIEVDETWDLARRRSVLAQAADLLRRRGTAGGLAAEVHLATGGEVEIVENGASAWSVDPGSPMVGSPHPALLVRVHAVDPGTLDRERLERLVEAAKPAHLPHRIEIVGADAETPDRRRGAARPVAPIEGTEPKPLAPAEAIDPVEPVEPTGASPSSEATAQAGAEDEERPPATGDDAGPE